ncbi:MAG: RNase adapter RapZ [Candidatus Electrothrix sp. GW3-4]|uniref:RapZ C-terminal domain-containing protein n=1 Tax=Candidatus Electrothrix sp. GW3-4 TaxID=3126740 RepID=UPI0030D4806A
MKITLFSFGFKHGYPDANIVWDVRFLPNPYWDEHLREHTGQEEQVATYALENAKAREFLQHLVALLAFTLIQHKAGKREGLRCAIGCTGGRHRSVAVVEYLRNILSKHLDSEDELIVSHRDIDKK